MQFQTEFYLQLNSIYDYTKHCAYPACCYLSSSEPQSHRWDWRNRALEWIFIFLNQHVGSLALSYGSFFCTAFIRENIASYMVFSRWFTVEVVHGGGLLRIWCGVARVSLFSLNVFTTIMDVFFSLAL
jgi:hypothetical protein